MDYPNFVIDPEFESLIPPLAEDEFEQLKENILHDGMIRHAIVTWNGVIIDGHHRYKILKEHPHLPYSVDKKDFVNKEEAVAWICANQLGRRNLSYLQKVALMGRKCKAEKDSHGSQARFEGDYSPSDQNEHLERNESTAERIAKEFNTSPATVRRAEEFVDGMDAAEAVLPGITKEIISGKVKPTQSEVAAIAKAPIEKRKEMAERLYIPKKLTEEQKAARTKSRVFNKNLDALYL